MFDTAPPVGTLPVVRSDHDSRYDENDAVAVALLTAFFDGDSSLTAALFDPDQDRVLGRDALPVAYALVRMCGGLREHLGTLGAPRSLEVPNTAAGRSFIRHLTAHESAIGVAVPLEAGVDGRALCRCAQQVAGELTVRVTETLGTPPQRFLALLGADVAKDLAA